MIEIAWYNVVAIVVGILFVCLMCSFDDDHGFLAGIGGAFIFFFDDNLLYCLGRNLLVVIQ